MRWFYIPGKKEGEKVYVNLSMLRDMLKEEEDGQNYEYCAILLECLNENEVKG